jgi:hypothetical protein
VARLFILFTKTLLVVPMILYKSLVVPMAICMLGLESSYDNVMTMWLWMCQEIKNVCFLSHSCLLGQINFK